MGFDNKTHGGAFRAGMAGNAGNTALEGAYMYENIYAYPPPPPNRQVLPTYKAITGRVSLAAAALLAFGLVLAGCGDGAGDEKKDTSDNTKPPTTWMPAIGTGLEKPFNGVAYGQVAGKDKFVAVGYDEAASKGTIAFSEDGKDWQKVENSTFSGEGSCIYGVAFGGGTFVAVGAVQTAYSTDGETWYAVTSRGFGSVVYGKVDGTDTFLASDGEQTAISTDGGKSWEVKDNKISNVAFVKDTFVGLGPVEDWKSTISYSEDGKTWATATNTGLSQITAVTYGGGKYVAVGGGGLIAYSTDGTEWTKVGGISDHAHFRAVTHDDGMFVAVGDGSEGHDLISYSKDGITWERSDLEIKDNETVLNGVTYGGGKFVAVGTDAARQSVGKILYSNNTRN